MTELGYAHPPLPQVRAIIQRALDEDVSWGDVTTDNSVPEDQWSRAVLLAKNNKVEPVDLPFDNGSLPEKNAAGANWDVPPNMTLEEIEKFVIERTLQRTGGNKQAAANLLGIYRPRLYSKIKKYKIDIPALIAS